MQVTLPFLAEQLDVGKESLRVAGRLGEVAFHSHASPLTPFWAEIVLPLPKGQGERTPMNAVEIALGKAAPVTHSRPLEASLPGEAGLASLHSWCFTVEPPSRTSYGILATAGEVGTGG